MQSGCPPVSPLVFSFSVFVLQQSHSFATCDMFYGLCKIRTSMINKPTTSTCFCGERCVTITCSKALRKMTVRCHHSKSCCTLTSVGGWPMPKEIHRKKRKKVFQRASVPKRVLPSHKSRGVKTGPGSKNQKKSRGESPTGPGRPFKKSREPVSWRPCESKNHLFLTPETYFCFIWGGRQDPSQVALETRPKTLCNFWSQCRF